MKVITEVHEIEHEQAGQNITPLKAVRRHCLECCNGSAHEVSLCAAKSCPLWPFRFGRKPTDGTKADVADRLLHPAERKLTGKDFHNRAVQHLMQFACDA
jgi:hypothetical protein